MPEFPVLTLALGHVKSGTGLEAGKPGVVQEGAEKVLGKFRPRLREAGAAERRAKEGGGLQCIAWWYPRSSRGRRLGTPWFPGRHVL